jgi:hypothetical protein
MKIYINKHVPTPNMAKFFIIWTLLDGPSPFPLDDDANDLAGAG